LGKGEYVDESSKTLITWCNEWYETYKKPKIKANTKEKYEISQPIGPLKEEAKELQTKIDSFKKTQELAKESKETIQKALDKINQERNTLRGQIEELRQQKLKLREDFYKKLLAYERQQIEIRDIEWMTGIKERVMQREEEKK
jgi:chromosome segregation ATPase